MVSASTVSAILLLFMGLVVALLGIAKQQNRAQTSNMVRTPMIGMTFKQGPWPKCIGMDGDECCQYIMTYAKDIQDNCVLVGPDEAVTEDFNTKRVRVYVDNDSIVTKAPSRG